MVLSGVLTHLTTTPLERTRNRKPLRPNLVGQWELRLGNLRVHYHVVDEPEQIVTA